MHACFASGHDNTQGVVHPCYCSAWQELRLEERSFRGSPESSVTVGAHNSRRCNAAVDALLKEATGAAAGPPSVVARNSGAPCQSHSSQFCAGAFLCFCNLCFRNFVLVHFCSGGQETQRVEAPAPSFDARQFKAALAQRLAEGCTSPLRAGVAP